LYIVDESEDTGGKKIVNQGSYEDVCADCLGRSLYLILAVKTYWKGKHRTSFFFSVLYRLQCMVMWSYGQCSV